MDQNLTFTYQELQVKAIAFANGLIGHGIRPSDSLLLWTDNKMEALASFYASAVLGLHCHVIDPEIHEDEHLE